MKVHPICPCCGYDISVDTPVVINDFTMHGSRFPLFFKGERVPLTTHESLICWTLLKAYPGAVSSSVICERLGSEPDQEGTVRVLICRIRKKLRALNAPESIVTLHGHHSYSWATGAEYGMVLPEDHT